MTEQESLKALGVKSALEGRFAAANLLLTALVVKGGGRVTVTLEEMEHVITHQLTAFAEQPAAEDEKNTSLVLVVKPIGEAMALVAEARKEKPETPAKPTEVFFLATEGGNA